MAHILVIDDEEGIRSFLRLCLQGQGHRISEASNGRAALRLYQADPADLVITDIIMPEGEGIETILALRHEAVGVPVIAMSGATNSELFLHASRVLGARRTLTKPFSGAMLLHAVDNSLAGSAAPTVAAPAA